MLRVVWIQSITTRIYPGRDLQYICPKYCDDSLSTTPTRIQLSNEVSHETVVSQTLSQLNALQALEDRGPVAMLRERRDEVLLAISSAGV